jgi:hypothetical protein
VWHGLTSIGAFIQENVVPIFASFFNWLLNWFTDSSKNQQLLAAITSIWTFISSWANTIISFVSPYFSDFFSWLFSWVTDSNKNQQLLNGIATTWNWLVDWGKNVINSVTPYFTSLFNWLFSWVTDSGKRQQLLNGIATTWNWFTQWASYIWTSIQPYLSSLWANLTSWIIDPGKRQQLVSSLLSSWNWFTQWSGNIWANVSPHLITVGANLKNWIDTNYPNLSSWVTSFSNTSNQIKNDWLANWPTVTKTFQEFVTLIKTEVPLLVDALSKLYLNVFGESETSIGDYFSKVTQFYTRYFGFIIKTARIATEMLNEMVETTKSAFAFDWNGYVSNSMEFGNKLSELWTQIASMPQLGQGYATGGITSGGRILVGEKGPEVVDLPGGSRVWDHGQSMGKLLSNNNQQPNTTINNQTTNDYSMFSNIVQQFSRAFSLINEHIKTISYDWSQSINNTNSKNLDTSNFSSLYNYITKNTNETENTNSKNLDTSNFSSLYNYITKNTKETENANSNMYDNTKNNYSNQSSKGTKSTLDIYIHNESKFPLDRNTVQEIARALQKELNLSGNRVVFAT